MAGRCASVSMTLSDP